jgi:FkbM family methyltransferase
MIPKEELQVFSSLKGIRTVIDVGARTDIDMYMLKPEYEYHLFEAHKPFFDQLPTDKGLHLYNVALDEKPQQRTYNVGTQSFENPSAGEEVNYQTKRLDDFNIKADFIKIDAEGMDYKILLGAPKTIKQAKYIQFEYWDGVKKFTELLQGFEFYLMMEPELRKVALDISKDDKYKQSLVPLDIDFVDKQLIRNGAGGNILAKRI